MAFSGGGDGGRGLFGSFCFVGRSIFCVRNVSGAGPVIDGRFNKRGGHVLRVAFGRF